LQVFEDSPVNVGNHARACMAISSLTNIKFG